MDWTPHAIRELRGDLSRADFAERVGVRQLTIYRWELDQDHSESRRPRTANRQALTRLAMARATDDDLSEPAQRCLAALDAGEWRDARRTALRELDTTRHDLVVRQLTLAMIALFVQGDPPAALTSLGPVLNTSQHPSLLWRVLTTGALIFASADGTTFDAGKAIAMATSIAPSAPAQAHVRAHLAELMALAHMGQRHLLDRRMSPGLLEGATHPVDGVLALRALAISATVHGKSDVAMGLLQTMRQRALDAGLAPMVRWSTGQLTLLMLRELGAPLDALDLLTTCRTDTSRCRPEAGSLICAAAEAEALFRAARFDEAAVVVAQTHLLAEDLDWPPIDLVHVQMRQSFHDGGATEVCAVRDWWRKNWSERGPTCDAVILSLTALETMVRGDLARCAEQWEQARVQAHQAGSRPWLECMCATLRYSALAYAGEHQLAMPALRTAGLTAERLPSAWAHAILQHVMGVHFAMSGQAAKALELLQSSEALLQRAGDVSEAARTRRALAIASWVLQLDGAQALLHESDVELAALGIDVAPVQSTAWLQQLRQHDQAPGAPRPLAIPLRRLSTRGLSLAAMQRELPNIFGDWLHQPASLTHVDELTDRAKGHWGPPDLDGFHTHMTDGCGGCYLLRLAGPVPEEQRDHLQLVLLTASLALEAATLRGARPPTPQQDVDSPVIDGIVSESAAMKGLLRDLALLRDSPTTLLILGESGVGKEVIARAAHDMSVRSDKPYVVLNSATVPEALFESQLFGHKRGAFTGATRDNVGLIRAADGGTLFLDEIGELPLTAQAKLLRFLENAEIQPVGETRAVQVDVRIIAATHRDLAQMVERGTFRQDLYYRLQVVPLYVPPLRDRPEDIVPLAERFLHDGGEGAKVGAGAAARLKAHPWPGNARELRNVVQRSVALSGGKSVLDEGDLRF